MLAVWGPGAEASEAGKPTWVSPAPNRIIPTHELVEENAGHLDGLWWVIPEG